MTIPADSNRLWRSLDELENTPAFREAVEREFPQGATEWDDGASRRRFLQLMGASISLAGLTGCTKQPAESIMPYVDPPEQVVPGKPLYFATAVLSQGLPLGVLVESHMGRPTKIEGNPDHPASLGATDVTAQAAVLGLYDPDRSKSVRGPAGTATWADFALALRPILERHRTNSGAGLRILTETVVSPTLGSQLQQLRDSMPGMKWVQYDPCGPHSARRAAQIVFGRPVDVFYRFEQAKVVLSLDSDFLACGGMSTRFAHDFTRGRRARGGASSMNRLYVAESTMTSTGGKADHRWALTPHRLEAFASELAIQLQIPGVTAAGASRVPEAEIEALANDLTASRGQVVIVPGEYTSPRVHAIAHLMNSALDGLVAYSEPTEIRPVDQLNALRELVDEMNAGAVETLVVIGGNPVWNAPSDIPFTAAARKVRNRIRLGLYEDETSAICGWHLPETHSLEAWSDAKAFDNTVTILQPLIAPLYEGRSAHELVALLMNSEARGYDIVRQHWISLHTNADFENWWQRSVQKGVVDTPAPAQLQLKPSTDIPGPPKVNAETFTVAFRPDPYIDDGRFANNAWLQELSRPMTKLTWDNAVLLSPRTAQRLGVKNEDVVELSHDGRTVRGPVWVQPGQPDDSATLHLGFGRKNGGTVAAKAGFNVYPLRTSGALWSLGGVTIRKTGEVWPLATTQMHQTMDGREPVLSAQISALNEDPQLIRKKSQTPPKELTLYPQWNYTGNAWGMAIDLTACVNCNACVVACQAENNIPVVGKEQVRNNRHMHWLRIDTYYSGDPANPSAHYQPVPCMHCENAPCEVVCPTQATNHSHDGLNDMVYNRCVGTRYCSNNCPYKVRRFNFLLYADWNTPSLKLQRNPDVTVRSRGVMEKCTYCVQRIRGAEIQARIENRPIRDGEIQTACQQACPAEAITFGNINDRNSEVSKLKADRLNYGLLAELNTRPRTTYLAEIRNQNPVMRKKES